MEENVKNICYDRDLKLEAYSFNGIVQPFPNHIHDYYVAGIVEKGGRILNCRNKEYLLWRGDVLLLSPNDNHGCVQKSKETFVYKAVIIPKDVMHKYVKEFAPDCENFSFTENVIKDDEIYNCLALLYQMIMLGAEKFEKEEQFLVFVSLLFENYNSSDYEAGGEANEQIEKACRFMKTEYGRQITLDELCTVSMLGKSTLLRYFTKTKGITPYRYLQSVRIDKAKNMLEQGKSTAETALAAGFSDQSHFTRYFNHFIGVSPYQYKRIFESKRGNTNGD